MIPVEWLTAVPMNRLIGHWTAGTNKPNADDLRAYHFLVDGDGRWHRGVPVERNSGTLKNGYAAHTLNANTDALGVSMCGMAGAIEVPFSAGRYPITPVQFDAFIAGCHQLSDFYRIPVARDSLLFHAEVQANLGIAQRAKWDVVRLPFLPEIKTAAQMGDLVRARIKGVEPNVAPVPVPAGGVGIVTAPSLNARRSPNGPVSGSLPHGTKVVVVGMDLPWLNVRTPAGHEVWVHGDHVDIVDGPPPVEPTHPAGTDDLAGILARLDSVERRLAIVERR